MKNADEPMLLAGTLDLLVLRALVFGPQHGYAVARWIRDTSKETIEVEDRALYLSLHRLEDRELIESEWAVSDTNRRAKFYGLTPEGQRQLRIKERAFSRYVDAVFAILKSTDAPA